MISNKSKEALKRINRNEPDKTKRFIKKAKYLWKYEYGGDIYDYSKAEYLHSKSKIKIICPEHGPFIQEPGNHLSGFGCPQCGVVSRTLQLRSNTDKFIEKAKSVYGDKYNYSKVNYVHSQKKVDIICKEHGVFSRTPNSFLRGWGCSECGDKLKISIKKDEKDQI